MRPVRPSVGTARVVALVLSVVFGGLFGSSCHRRLIRWTDAEQHQRVVTHVASSKFEPRDAAARAFATSLVALGDTERGRAVLLRDFRRGGHVPSLVALADIEARDGRIGMAAVNYARAMALDAPRLAGRGDICEIFRRRAAEMLALDDAVAADHDMRRVTKLCGSPQELTQREADIEIWRRIAAAAAAQARAQRTLMSAALSKSQRRGIGSSQEWTAASSAQLRVRARESKLALEPTDVVKLLVAEARGDLGAELLDDAELRARVGNADWDEVAPFVAGLSPTKSGYVKVRLAVVFDVPGAQTAHQRQQLLAQSLGDGTLDGRASGFGWRIAALQSGAAVAELALKRYLTADESDGASASSEASANATGSASGSTTLHWMLRAPATGEFASALLTVGRLRADRQFDGLTVASARRVLTESSDATLAVAEVRRALGMGRPWYALALADAARSGVLERVSSAIGTAISLQRAACGGMCSEFARDDRNVAAQVVGERRLAQLEREMVRAAAARAEPQAPVDACPTIEQLLAEPRSGSLAEVVAHAVAARSTSGLAQTLGRAIESDAGLACAGRFATVLLAEGRYELTAATLADRLGMAPELESSDQLELHAELALIAGQRTRARRLSIEAAAVSTEPRRVWARAAFFARRIGAREHELEAWRQVLLHGAGDATGEVEAFLVHRQLLDIAGDEPTSQLAVAREAATVNVRRHFDGAGAAARWAREEELAEALAGRSWSDASGLERVMTTVIDAGLEPDRHPRPWRALTRLVSTASDSGAPSSSAASDARSDDTERANVKWRSGETIAAPFIRIDALAKQRATTLWREDPADESVVPAAVGLATVGDVETRGVALQWLLAHAGTRSEATRAAVLDVMVRGGVALPPDAPTSARLLPDGDLVYRLALGLDLDTLELRAKTRAWGSSLSRQRAAAMP